MSTPKKLSRAEGVALQIEDEVLERRLPVGAHLGRRVEMMERFKISPTIMNEVLRILRDRGLVMVRPGNGGGIFVNSHPPQVRLGGMDLWFNDTATHPLDLFEARLHLESALAPLSFERATQEQVSRMYVHLAQMRDAREARDYMSGTLELHRALVASAGVSILDEMHQVICALLGSSLSRASFVEGYEQLLADSLKSHVDLIDAIARQDRAAFREANERHDEHLTRAHDPRRSPVVHHAREDGDGAARGFPPHRLAAEGASR